MFTPGDQVINDRLGLGTVIADMGRTVVVRYPHGIEECEVDTVRRIHTPVQALNEPMWHAPISVITRLQAEAIQSVNDAWGVFSRSRIALLPHQLWVCRQVLSSWPTRWLVADDVGLGKTIEAGLILLPVLARGDVHRVLVLCPASLVEQWQYRMRTMFDIRLARYSAEADSAKADFWGTQHQVVVSLQTLRKDSEGRHERLLEAEPWDLVVVDEAHHLNADEETGPTLGYRLIDKMLTQERIRSMVFFTGTPHRGKHYGFLSLLTLLRPDLFDPGKPLRQQLPQLCRAMIRNNKQNVTDLQGRRLFQSPINRPEQYSYSPEESNFYRMLTEFIATGKAYASTLSSNDGRAVMLVLFAMQKLASSSVAAILRALRGRLARTSEGRQELQRLQAEYEQLEATGELDALSDLDQKIVELSARIRLMSDEEPKLRELIGAAEAVQGETKIAKILSILDKDFAGRAVLLFTEYKATQSLLMSALIDRFGEGCVSFINGDERAEGVVGKDGKARTITETRDVAADQFNRGEVRFLVSTEAGGEGIDLQEQCHSLIHVDLPWNPMRLHQRVGRLNRYGQTKQVEVFTIRNPETVESHIWDKLNVKIGNIMTALSQVMDEPEDLLQLVLGMTSPSLFRELFTEGTSVPKAKLSEWFDSKSARFGGHDVVETVRDLVGHCAKFDFQQVSSQIPRVDLADLRPFFVAMLEINHRKVQEDDRGLHFKTPDAWFKADASIRQNYQGLIFDRNNRDKDAAQKVLGVGHKLVNLAVAEARRQTFSVTMVASKLLPESVYVYRISDRVTTTGATGRAVIVAVKDGREAGLSMLPDWELLQLMNGLVRERGLRRQKAGTVETDRQLLKERIEISIHFLQERLDVLDLPFAVPVVDLTGIIVSGDAVAAETSADEGEEEG